MREKLNAALAAPANFENLLALFSSEEAVDLFLIDDKTNQPYVTVNGEISRMGNIEI